MNEIAVVHNSLPCRHGNHLSILHGKVLDMDHRHILSQNINGVLYHILLICSVGSIQKIHRIQNDLQVRGSNGTKHLPRPFRAVYNVLAHRLNRHHHTHFSAYSTT